MTLLGGLLRERAIKDEDLWGRWARGDDVDDTPGRRVSPDAAMQLSAVWACVSLISDAISTLPLGVYERRDGARLPVRQQPRWVAEPNPEQDPAQWVSQQVVAMLLDGTAYVYTPRGRRQEITEAWNVPARMVTPRRRGEITYDVSDPRHGQLTLTRAEMFHVPALSWPGELRGIAPLEAARHMLTAGLGAQEFAERFYAQGFSAAGVVEVPGDLTIEQARELKQDFGRMNGGVRRSHLPAVLTQGAQWKTSRVTPEQAQFLETRRFSVMEIARFFRVPPHMIGDVERSTSWGSGIEQQGIAFVTHTLLPWLSRLEQAYTRHLLMFERGAFAKFNVAGLMRGDFKSRMDGYATAIANGLMCADDVRALEDQPPLPDGLGQTFYVQGALRPVDEPYRPNTDDGGASGA